MAKVEEPTAAQEIQVRYDPNTDTIHLFARVARWKETDLRNVTIPSLTSDEAQQLVTDLIDLLDYRAEQDTPIVTMPEYVAHIAGPRGAERIPGVTPPLPEFDAPVAVRIADEHEAFDATI